MDILKKNIESFLLNCQFEKINDNEFSNDFGTIILEEWDHMEVLIKIMQLGIELHKEKQEELTIEDLINTVAAIYACNYSSCDLRYDVFVDPNSLKEGEREFITKFWSKHRDDFNFIFKHQNL
jgi:hypothetical protein